VFNQSERDAPCAAVALDGGCALVDPNDFSDVTPEALIGEARTLADASPVCDGSPAAPSTVPLATVRVTSLAAHDESLPIQSLQSTSHQFAKAGTLRAMTSSTGKRLALNPIAHDVSISGIAG
jgi:hypothetical protein